MEGGEGEEREEGKGVGVVKREGGGEEEVREGGVERGKD